MKDKKVKLTSRDVVLLKDIYDNSFLSFYQIHEAHFAENKRPTVYNRLSKLIRADFLESLNINLFLYHKNNESVGVIYRITKKGIRELANFYFNEPVEQSQMSLNLSSLYHDLLLIDVTRKIKKLHPHLIVTSSKKIADWENSGRIPDAIIFDPMTKNKLALELELTAKSEQRYRDIIVSYRTNPEIQQVLYVIKDVSIQNKIGGLITGFKGQYSKDDDTDKFKFIELKQFLSTTYKENFSVV